MTPRRPGLLCFAYLFLISIVFLMMNSTYRKSDATRAAEVFVQTDSILSRVLGKTPRLASALEGAGNVADVGVLLNFRDPRATVSMNLDVTAGNWKVLDYRVYLPDTSFYVTLRVYDEPAPDPNDKVHQADQARLRHDYAGALRLLDAAIAANPQDARAWAMRGWTHQDMRDFHSARNDFARAYQLDSDNFEAAYGYSAELGRAGQYALSIEISSRAIELDPSSGEAHFVRAFSRGNSGDPDAVDDLREACRLAYAPACEVMQQNGISQ